MSNLQRTLYTPGFIASGKTTNADILKQLSSESLDSSKTASQIAWMRKPEVIAFIASIPMIKNETDALDSYVDHIEACGAFESIARTTRSVKKDRKNGKQKGTQRKKSPGWYGLYLTTNHWGKVRLSVLAHYSSCALCSCDGNVCHHKHYNSLGKEDVLKDMSLLCENCHHRVHEWLGVRVPRMPTIGALFVFKNESMCNGRHRP